MTGAEKRPVSFFCCDPPYYATESYYKDVGFTKKDHVRLHDTLAEIKGKFLVSYNDCPEIRELWYHDGIRIESVSRIDNLRQRYKGGAEVELAITVVSGKFEVAMFPSEDDEDEKIS